MTSEHVMSFHSKQIEFGILLRIWPAELAHERVQVGAEVATT